MRIAIARETGEMVEVDKVKRESKSCTISTWNTRTSRKGK